jgi:uncharacterized protein YjbJ (UPF0337 family)
MEVTVMNRDELKGQAEQIRGEAKQEVGALTGNERMRAEGVVEEVKGKARERLGRIRRRFARAVKKLER